MFIDDVTLTIKAGDGGNGAATFARNARTSRGGPDGGNGGNGGSIYFVANPNVNDLQEFRYKKEIEALTGIPGKKNKLFGKNAPDLTITVPLGTRLSYTQEGNLYAFDIPTTPMLIARGGRGGKGNTEFKSATNQAPTFAEKGGLGEAKEIRLELRLIADVGFIGLPNAGKSSLLASLTNAQPKIANYPFTTLEPNIGVMNKLTLADIPGLIEGAAQGKGLGIKFLKHIEKTKLLIHCIEVTTEDPLKTYEIVRKEFEEYSKELLEKPEIILLTKTDLATDDVVKEQIKRLKKTKRKIYPISIYNDEDLEKLKKTLLKLSS